MNSIPASDLGRAGQLVAGKFRLDAVIGRGGMGSVWAATHMGLGHRVAIKLISRQYIRSAEALRRFEAEAKAAARLQSRHVVQVFDNGTLEDGTPFIAMELLAGENVGDRIARLGPMPLMTVVETLTQCCKALGRAHAAGIVHRDIKPDNIFLAVEPDGDGDVVKILDFGVAKMTMDVETESQLTGSGTLLGTPLYMSPEQIRGARDVDLRADLYSLGMVAFTMLAARSAISGEAFGDILVKICTQPLPSLLAAAPSLPPPVEAWFQRACAREPAGRFQSALEFSEALRAAASAPARPNATPWPLGMSVAVASTLAAPVVTPLPGSLSLQPSGIGTGATGLAPMGGSPMGASHQGAIAVPSLAVAPAAPPAFSQSAAAVSLTAAGVPRRRVGLMVAGWGLASLVVAGGIALAVVYAARREDPAATQAASATASTPAPAPPPPSSSAPPASPPVASVPQPAIASPEAAAPSTTAIASAAAPPHWLAPSAFPPGPGVTHPLPPAPPPARSAHKPTVEVGY